MIRALHSPIVIVAVAALVSSGCSRKKPAAAAPAPVTTAAALERASRDSIDRVAAAERAATERTRLEAERRQAREVTVASLTTPVYFELDQADITDEGRRLLDEKGDAMRRQPEIRIRIEGHADDTGSDEYNMALGERRAATARRYLVQLGIAESRMQIVSRGEERPACADRQESCRSRNRRDEFIILSGI